MKIISKYKDYYDYLQGIYGIDEEIVLDRRAADGISPIITKRWYSTVVNVYICGKVISGIKHINSEFICFNTNLNSYQFYLYENGFYNWINNKYLTQENLNFENNVNYYYRRGNNFNRFHNNFEDDENNVNEFYDCPIIIEINGEIIKYPPLFRFGIEQFLPAEQIYNMLYEWLIRDPNIIDSRTNIEKIESHGFDKKISFRNM